MSATFLEGAGVTASVGGMAIYDSSTLRHGDRLEFLAAKFTGPFDPVAARAEVESHALAQVQLKNAARCLEQNAIMQADEEFIKQLLEEEDKAAALAARVFMCPICREDVPIDGCVTLSCEHRYCVDCFAGYVESKISEKAVTEASLQCAIPGCTTSITPHEVSGHVSKEMNLKFLNFAAEITIESDPNHVRCPRCSLLTLFPPKDEHPEMWAKAVCPNQNCAHKFCALCKEESHDGTCEAYATWRRENGLGDESFAKLMLEQQWSKCPHCGMPVVLEEGCFFMTCKPPCGKNFCYICGCKLLPSDHYTHFPAGGPYKRPCLTQQPVAPPPPPPPAPQPAARRAAKKRRK